MGDLYRYMKQKRQEMYDAKSYEVTISQARFFQLFKLVCDMMQVQCLMKQYDDEPAVNSQVAVK